jgi:hypothetical protein
MGPGFRRDADLGDLRGLRVCPVVLRFARERLSPLRRKYPVPGFMPGIHVSAAPRTEMNTRVAGTSPGTGRF